MGFIRSLSCCIGVAKKTYPVKMISKSIFHVKDTTPVVRHVGGGASLYELYTHCKRSMFETGVKADIHYLPFMPLFAQISSLS